MSILVLGGSGYIGSHTALELIRTGESVIIDPPKKVCKNSANCDIIEVTQEADFLWQ